MYANSDLDGTHGGVIGKDGRFGRSLESADGKLRNAFGMVILLILYKICHADKCIANGFNPVHFGSRRGRKFVRIRIDKNEKGSLGQLKRLSAVYLLEHIMCYRQSIKLQI